MAIDVGQLVTDMKNAATQVVSKDISKFEGFSEMQMKAIAQQAAFVEAGILTGDITSETKEFFLDSLKDMARNFVNVLVGMVNVEVEKVWNAIVDAIWKALATAIGTLLK